MFLFDWKCLTSLAASGSAMEVTSAVSDNRYND